MKYLLQIIFSIGLLIGSGSTYCQNLIIKSDTIPYAKDTIANIVLPQYRGQMFWQVSYDQKDWITFKNKDKDTLSVDLDLDAWYRAKVVDGTCNTVYSDTVQVVISDSLKNHYENIVMPVAYPDVPGEIVNVFFNNDTITCRKVNDEYVFQGDMILTEKQILQITQNKGASIPTDDVFLKLWPNTIIYYSINYTLNDLSGIPDKRITDAIMYWEKITPIKFKQRENEENFVEFIRVNDGGSSSNVGMIGGEQHIYVADEDDNGNNSTYDIRHEIGHTIGLFHEQSRADRDKYIKVHEDRINNNWIDQYKIMNSESLGAFDFESIMLYPPCSKTAALGDNFVLMTKKDPTTGEDTGIPWSPKYKKQKELSSQDIAFINWLYATSPFVSTAGVTDVTETSATCGGNVTNDGGTEVTERGICWNTDGNPDINSDNKVAAGNGLGHYTANIQALLPNQQYFVRAYATNSKGTRYGNEQRFTTYSSYFPPNVKTNPIRYEIIFKDSEDNLTREIESVNIYCGGEITSDGGLNIVERGVCWNLTGNPDIADSKLLDENLKVGVYSLNLTDLLTVSRGDENLNITYYIKAYASNEKGISYGDEIVFNRTYLASDLPIIVTNEVTKYSQSSARYSGNIVFNGTGTIKSTGFCWNTSGNPTQRNETKYVEREQYNFSDEITDLLPNTKYYIRAFANVTIEDNGKEINFHLYGNQVVFTTLPFTKPSISTLVPTNLSQNSVTLNGEVTSDGGTPIISRGFYWCEGGIEDPTINGKKEIITGTTGKFSTQLSELKPNTLYSYVAFATNSIGTTTGNMVQVFRTDPEAPVGIPQLVSPADYAVFNKNNTGTINIAWESVSGSDEYWLNVFPDGQSASPVFNASVGGAISKTIAVNTLSNGIYRFQVRARRNSGEWSEYSAVRQFIADTPAAAPVLTAPENETIVTRNTQQSFSWVAPSDRIARYYLRIVKGNNLGAFPVYTAELSALNHVVNCSWEPETYSWSVRAIKETPVGYVESVYETAMGWGNYAPTRTFLVKKATTLPTLSTNTATAITQTTATGGGNITDDGGATVTARGICWSTSPNPVKENNYATNGSGSGTFTCNITGLSAGTKYYVRAFATNSFGTAYGNELYFTTLPENILTGTFTDSRDGRVYKWVKIGNQTWMAENLAYNLGNGCWIYNNDENNLVTYGRLYSWDAALKASPAGWHLPSNAEWNQLASYINGLKGPFSNDGNQWENVGGYLKAKSGWNNGGNGTDDFGFNGLPGLGWNTNQPGEYAGWWTSEDTGADSLQAYHRFLYFENSSFRLTTHPKEYGYSLRCIKD